MLIAFAALWRWRPGAVQNQRRGVPPVGRSLGTGGLWVIGEAGASKNRLHDAARQSTLRRSPGVTFSDRGGYETGHDRGSADYLFGDGSPLVLATSSKLVEDRAHAWCK